MELRWNPVAAEWVVVSAKRKERPILERESCPFCPGSSEIPDGDWDVLVLENKFPSLTMEPPEPDQEAMLPYKVKPSYGACLVVIYSPDHSLHLGRMPTSHIEKIVGAWSGLMERFSSDTKVKYVLVFENRGKEMGVTIEHPHGQVYAFPFIPPIIRREMEVSRHYFTEHKCCLFCDVVKAEISARSRLVYQNRSFISFIPFAPKMPYGVSIYPRRHVADLLGLNAVERHDLSESIRQVVARLDDLFKREMPYSMVLHQQPTDRSSSDFYHFHVEFFPKYRERDKLKFLAGVELGAGTVTYDYLPEEKAAELREVR
ncbi:MAG TPA: galactose-1-phosphate uridylyltransferase [Thermoproteota archaeon]|nr:galactose-1-phosphate uridylyltransferase [Thermoproteota archaeon]